MSKASEYAAQYVAHTHTAPLATGGQEIELTVAPNGNCWFRAALQYDSGTLAPKEALALGQWLVDMYGENK